MRSVPLGSGCVPGRCLLSPAERPGKSTAAPQSPWLGDAANTATRLSSQAQPGEVLISKDAYQAARLAHENLELRQLQLGGRSQPIEAYATRIWRADQRLA